MPVPAEFAPIRLATCDPKDAKLTPSVVALALEAL